MLTVKEIDAAKPREKPWKLHDERGLYLEIKPTGSRLWRFKYSLNGRENRISFGAYPDVPLKLARERRELARQSVAAGIDPSAARKQAKLERFVAARD